ncbi:MAG: VanZ family protein [Chitinispirillaceae bacterium]|nr:VanZ family protein [Chitinispirillaceae bacterium]
MIQSTENITYMSKKIRILHLIVIIIVNIVISGGIICAGLWPFNFFPENGCYLNEELQTLNFKAPGITYLRFFRASDSISSNDSPLSIKLELESSRMPEYSAYILDISNRSGERFSLLQWKSSLIVQLGSSRISFSDVMEPGYRVKVAITAEGSVLNVRCNKMQKTLKGDLLNKLLDSKPLLLVAGNDPSLRKAWFGIVYSLQLKKNGSSVDCECMPIKKRSDSDGEKQHSMCRLLVPERMVPLKMAVLTPPWEDFKKGRRYELDLLLNAAGFVPIGFSLCLLLTLVFRMKRYWMAVIIICFLLSLFIEFSQSFLITRTSQMSDLILNSWGGALGVVLYVIVLEMFNSRRGKRRCV